MILANKSLGKSSSGGGLQIITQLEEFIVNFILPIVLVAVSTGIISLYIRPAHKSLPDLKEQINAKSTEVETLQAKVTQLSTLKQNKELLLSDLVKMSWALEERDKVPELSEQVRVMCNDSGVTFDSLGYANTNAGSTPSAANVSNSLTPDPNLYREEKVNVSINMPDISKGIAFLKTSENSIRLFKVETLSINGEANSRTSNLVMASPYLNPAFSTYSQTAAPIDLTNAAYRAFMSKLDNFRNYAKEIDSTIPNI